MIRTSPRPSSSRGLPGLVLLLFTLAGTVRAAEPDTEATPTAAPDVASASAGTPAPVDGAPTNTSASSAQPSASSGSASGDAPPSPEIFIPSEEISEDFTVSFPVDI